MNWDESKIEIEEKVDADITRWNIFYNNIRIGEFEFLKEKERQWLNDCALEEEYQGHGIGCYIISNAVKQFGEIYFCIADRIQLKNHYKKYDQRYLTREGIRFKDSLLRKKIIKHDWIKNPCLL